MAYWLLKTEPSECSIDDLAASAEKALAWEGVRNYQARNFLRQMQVGDEALIYHSSCKLIGVAGIVRITRAAYPDPAQFDPRSSYFDPKSPEQSPRWDAIDVKFLEKFPMVLTLDLLKSNAALQEFPLVKKGNRLSVMPVSEDQWRAIISAK